MALLIDLQAAEHREIEMSAADQAKGHCAVKGGCARQRGDWFPARVREPWQRHAGLWHGAGPDEAVLGLEKDMDPFGDECGHQGWNADTEIDEHAVPQFQGDTPCY